MNCESKQTEASAAKGLSAPRLILNSYTGANISGEAFVADHIFSYIISGRQDIWLSDKLHTFKEGDFRFFRRNQLSKYVKTPGSEGFKSIAAHIDQSTLKQIASDYSLQTSHHPVESGLILLRPDHLLNAYIESVKPYLQQMQTDPRIVALKARELVLLMIANNPALVDVLFDFSEPGKIDLEAFMNSHYRYNVDVDRFAFLTGRSLSGFKRDFEKLYKISPGRWLVQRRLQEAHFLIEVQGRKSGEVYLDLGFENLSHFSFAYKKEFGYAPTKGQH